MNRGKRIKINPIDDACDCKVYTSDAYEKYQKRFKEHRIKPWLLWEDYSGHKAKWYQKISIWIKSKIYDIKDYYTNPYKVLMRQANKHVKKNKIQYIDFTNISKISTIPANSKSVRGNRSKIISFYCDICNKWHIEVPIEEMIYVEDEDYTICKTMCEVLLEGENNE